MTQWTSVAPTVLASFMASLVEFVEALTIVLAVGVVRGWRSALLGTGAALALLMALVALLGPALTRIPLPLVQLVVGTLLLMFGLRWLRKAVLRAAGVLPLHDEAQAFAAETAGLRKEVKAAGRVIDKLAFAASFKIVMLEGIEVVFIVIAIGASGQKLIPASIGALLALLAVIGLGLWLHKPLARVPENALKFGVGVLLSAFGTFWVGEGIGLGWPAADWALLALVLAFFVLGLGLVKFCKSLHQLALPQPKRALGSTAESQGPLSVLVAKLAGLFIDDGWLAAGVVLWVFATWLLETYYGIAFTAGSLMLSGGLAAILVVSAGRRARIKT
jgi:uncharacterized membrane protein